MWHTTHTKPQTLQHPSAMCLTPLLLPLPCVPTAAAATATATAATADRVAPTRVRVQHDSYIRASRAAVWTLLQVINFNNILMQVIILFNSILIMARGRRGSKDGDYLGSGGWWARMGIA